MAARLKQRAVMGTDRLMAASANSSTYLVGALVAGGLAAAWTVTYVTGGTATPMPHFFYLPIVVAGGRFGHRGAVATALAAGILCGPLMPLDVAAHVNQPAQGWIIRLVFFVLIGQVVALLCGRSLAGVVSRLGHHRARTELEAAVADGQFFVVYQPLFDLHDGTLVSVEALVRWRHPERGIIAPNDFIADAEATGVIADIGAFVLGEATTQLAAWRRSGQADPGLKVSVNVSARQLLDADFARRVLEALDRSGLQPANLQLEVTESALITDLAEAARRVDALRELGIEIAIDDFGTGQSSLAYLHWFHPHVIKIDRVFVNALERRSRAASVAEGVIRLAASLGATTVAEGIETEHQADTMRALGCQVGQGYYYARPAPAHDIARMLPMTRRARGVSEAEDRPYSLPKT